MLCPPLVYTPRRVSHVSPHVCPPPFSVQIQEFIPLGAVSKMHSKLNQRLHPTLFYMAIEVILLDIVAPS